MQRSLVVAALQQINASPRKGSGDFVGAVYDTSSTQGNLPVAVVIGINYGQRASSASVVGRCEDNVGYASRVRALTGRDCHTVLWNFYPYLTEREWLQDVANASEQAERVFDLGYHDPFSVFSALVSSLQAEEIIFHGIRSAVPILARTAIRHIKRSAYLVPNFSRPFAASRAKKIT